MKKTLLICFCALLIAPLLVRGAYNDVTLGTDNVVINVAGINLDITGSDAVIQSITVNASDFSFVLLSGSFIQITSVDRRVLDSISGSSVEYHSSEVCDGSKSVTTFEPISGLANTITVTPSASTCTVPTSTASGSSGSSSGRSGGGGGGTVAQTTPVTAPVQTAVTIAPTASGASFSRNLSLGLTGDDVKALQTRLTSEGVYSGPITGYFGSLTQAGVKAYQAKYGIDQLGIVGPMTRTQLNKGTTTEMTVSGQLTPAQINTITSQINALLKQVQELQAQLKVLGN